eukprot:jgi/Chlat1/6509/Chrsp45S00472
MTSGSVEAEGGVAVVPQLSRTVSMRSTVTDNTDHHAASVKASRPQSQNSLASKARTVTTIEDDRRTSDNDASTDDEDDYLDANAARQLASNPFAVPTDAQLFHRAASLKRKDAKGAKGGTTQSKGGVASKSTFASRMARTLDQAGDGAADGSAVSLRQLYKQWDREADNDKDKEKDNHHNNDNNNRDLVAEAAMTSEGAHSHRRKEKENMSDFIAKKREIFLVQMSLDTKRAEIRKLEERALQREEALVKSEAMLEEDALRFDAFLKENDEKVQEAIKRAEMEAKAKQDKVHEIKRLTAAIAAIRSELNKYEEQLEDCRKYRTFLDALTPPEFWTAQQQVQQQLLLMQQQAQQAQQAAQTQQSSKTTSPSDSAPTAIATTDVPASEGQTDKDLTKDNVTTTNTNSNINPPVVDEMHFKHPRQLLDVFAQLEEQNLFLIQNCQETEEALEELKAKYRDTRARMDAESESLTSQIRQLQDAIKLEEEKGRLLDIRANGQEGGGNNANNTTTTTTSSGERASASVALSALQMLTNIEARLEEHLAACDALPAEERRVQRSLERAQAPVHKKTGKPVMFRSEPPRQNKKKADGEGAKKKTDEEEELAAFLARDY